jgi:hypothetical protein
LGFIQRCSAIFLQGLITTKTNNDAQTVAFITIGADRNTTDNLSTVTAGKAQLAGALAMNSADYSVAQLVILDAQNT